MQRGEVGQVAEVTSSLKQFAARMKKQGEPLSDEDLRDLAIVRFRDRQPTTVDGWHLLYLVFRQLS